jgi:hypothetical protein
MGPVRVVVTRIEPDGAMHRRVVETAWQRDPNSWDDLAARALAAQPPYRPIRAPPSTTLAWMAASSRSASMTWWDLCDLVIVVLATGSTM